MSWWSDVRALPGRVARIHNQMEKFMADTSPLLNQLAEDLRAYAAGPLKALLEENVTLKARNAELEGEDLAETDAAGNAVAAFNELANPVTASPDVPVEIPPVDVPSGEAPATPTDDTVQDPAAGTPVPDAESGDQPS